MAPTAPESKGDLLEDVSNSEAYKILESLGYGGGVEPEKLEYCKEKFSEIHGAFIQAMANEKNLVDEARSLKRRLDEELKQAKKVPDPGADEPDALGVLREDVEQAESEAALAQEREQLLQLEVTELQRTRNELQQCVDEVTEAHRQALLPKIEELRIQALELEEELELERERRVQAEKDVEECTNHIEDLAGQKKAAMKERDAEKSVLAKVSSLPEKGRRQNDLIANALKSLKLQEESLIARIKDKEATLTKLDTKQREIEEENKRIMAALDRGNGAIEGKERAIDDLQSNLEMAALEAQRYLADSAHLDIHAKSLQQAHKRQMDLVLRAGKERDAVEKKLKEAENSKKAVQAQLPELAMAKENMAAEIAACEAERKRLRGAIEELKREEDICMSAYLKEEAVGKAKAALFKLTYEEVASLEKEVEALKRDETDRCRAIQKLGSVRDRMSRMVSMKTVKLRETREQVQLKDLVITDLKNVQREAHRRVRDFEQLYDLVKNQRNKFVNLNQAAKQCIAEMKDKLKILGNELEILQNEVNAKDKLVSKSRVGHQSGVQDRDNLRGELNGVACTFRERQDAVEEQISRIEKLNAIVNGAEKDMLNMRRAYESVVQRRNYTGLMLIDRNDELCILYEKSNLQEEVLKQGEMELKRREDEIRILKLQIKQIEHPTEATRKLTQQIPELDEHVALLQKELLEARRQSEELSLALESPENVSRWRRLGGKAPDKDELTAKTRQLEERMNDSKERILEKELIHEELAALTERLRKQALQGKEDTLDLAKAVNAYQNKIQAVKRKMMATVSELSMYQATSLKLAAEKENLESVVKEAHARLEAGQPPTEEAAREWDQKLRTSATIEKLNQEREEVERILAERGTLVKPVMNRPNAYIPEELGIPKPYGANAPFKPSEVGSTMRHMRKPEPREIVI